MPIAGLTDRVRLDRIGRLRLGYKYLTPSRADPKKKVEVPQAVPWFLPNLKQDIHMAQVLDILKPYNPHVEDWDPDKWEVKPDRDGTPVGPNVVPITIPLDDSLGNGWNNIFPQWWKAYRSGTCVCIGDGRMVKYRVDKKTGEVLSADVAPVGECEPNTCQLAYGASTSQQKLCNRVGTFSFFLRGFPSFQVFVIDAKKMSILNLNTALLMMKGQYGSLQGLPALLTVSWEHFTVSGKQQTAPILHLGIDPREDYARFGTQRQIGAEKIGAIETAAADEPPDVTPDAQDESENAQEAASDDPSAPACPVCGKAIPSAQVDLCIAAGVSPTHKDCVVLDESEKVSDDDLPF